MAHYVNITLQEMQTLLQPHDFKPIHLPHVSEIIYSRLIDKDVCIRIYTGIVGNNSRKAGSDAIRVVTVKRYSNGDILPIIGGISRVNKTEGWKDSLQKRISAAIAIYESLKRSTPHAASGT